MARWRAIAGMILAAGAGAVKYFSSYHRLFSGALWSLDAMGWAVFRMFEASLDGVVMLGLDDTLTRKRGPKVYGTGMHYEPLCSSQGQMVTN